MNEESFLSRQRRRTGAEKASPAEQYTAKNFQLEVLGKLAEVQSWAESLEEAWRNELKAIKEQRLLKFDSRTLIALGAVALSIAGYVIQDARNTARQDSEIEATKARVVRLEQIAATNTEGRIRTEAELQELREGQAEIKALIQVHDSASRRALEQK
jgi:soluble cytochrome b562